MASTKISALDELLASATAADDEFVIIDKSDTSMGAGGTNKRITLAELKNSALATNAYDYVVYKEGSTYYARNGSTGDIDSENATASTVIQYTLDAVTSTTSKKRIVLTGDFTITTNLTVDDYTILDMTEASLTASSMSGAVIQSHTNGTQIDIVGGLIDCASDAGNGITMSGCSYFTIKDVRIKSPTSHCVNILGESSDFEVSGCYLEDSGDDGVSVTQNSHNGNITNNTLIAGSHNTAVQTSGIEIEDASHDLTISENKIRGFTNPAIKAVTDSGGTGACYNLTITGNVINGCTSGIVAQSSKSNITITGFVGTATEITVTAVAHNLEATHDAQINIYDIDDISIRGGINRPWMATYATANTFTIPIITINYDTETGAFEAGETLTGAGGATGTILYEYVGAGSTGTLIVGDIVGTFVLNEAITDSGTGAAHILASGGFDTNWAGDGEVYFRCSNITVADNTVEGGTVAGIKMNGVWASSISGNAVTSCYDGIVANTSKGISINDNSISYATDLAISLYACEWLSAQNNTVFLPGQGSGAAWSIKLNTCTDSIVANNVFVGHKDSTGIATGNRGIQSISGGTNRIYGNDVETMAANSGVKIQATSGDDCWDNKGATIYTETSTGAQVLPPAYHYVELGNTTQIAATMPASDHAGRMFTAVATLEPATTHTITLDSGTWDGTNTVATFADIKDKLVVMFDDDGDGVVLANIGSVALS